MSALALVAPAGMRLVQINGETMVLPKLGDPRYCVDYDEDCGFHEGLDNRREWVRCYTCPVMRNQDDNGCDIQKPCPLLQD